MNICVCIKQVPDTNEIKVDPVTHTLVRKGVPSVVNSFDTYAQEVGVRLKEKLGGKVVVISMGPEQAKEMSKYADGVIVGSAIVKLCGKYQEACVEPVREYVKSMRKALD